jgi:hypothetical protein
LLPTLRIFMAVACKVTMPRFGGILGYLGVEDNQKIKRRKGHFFYLAKITTKIPPRTLALALCQSLTMTVCSIKVDMASHSLRT